MGKFCMFPEIFPIFFLKMGELFSHFCLKMGELFAHVERKMGKFWETYKIFLKFSHIFSQCVKVHICFQKQHMEEFHQNPNKNAKKWGEFLGSFYMVGTGIEKLLI